MHADPTGASTAGGSTGACRLLVVAGEEVTGPHLISELRKHLADRDAEVKVISPAITDTMLRHAFGDVDRAREVARERLQHSISELRSAGIAASGEVGESDPVQAIEDALAAFPAEEILLVTHPDAEASRLEREAFERARERFEPPITHLIVERRDGEPTVAEVEHAPGRGDRPEREPAISENLPPLAGRDWLGIGFAIVGSIVLAILAAACEEPLTFECGAKYGIALGAGLISIAHVVGLVLMASVRYRGPVERFFADLVIWGMPPAIGASLLISWLA